MMSRSVVAVLVSVLTVGPAWAARADRVVQLDVQQPVAAQLQTVKQALDHADYSELDREQRLGVRSAVQAIEQVMAGREAVSQLDPAQRLAVISHQDEINTALRRAHQDSRLVCRREKVVGSNMPSNVCMTVAQRRQARDDGQRMMRDNVRPAGKPGN